MQEEWRTKVNYPALSRGLLRPRTAGSIRMVGGSPCLTHVASSIKFKDRPCMRPKLFLRTWLSALRTLVSPRKLRTCVRCLGFTLGQFESKQLRTQDVKEPNSMGIIHGSNGILPRKGDVANSSQPKGWVSLAKLG